jgi:DNA polymerase
MNLWIDLETYSTTPIAAGTYRYAEDSEIMLVAWAVDDSPARVWDRTRDADMPAELELALSTCTVCFAHNAQFDRVVLRRHFPALTPPLVRWRCTMAQALAHSLPGSLDALCKILSVPVEDAKIGAGKKLVQLFCKPRPATQRLRRATSATHPAEWELFVQYARQDVEAMRAVHARLPAWNYNGAELNIWRMDQVINDRGFEVDVDLAESAVRAIDRERRRLEREAREITEVRLTQRDAFLTHLAEVYGIVLDDLQGTTLDRLLESPDLPPEARELIAARQSISTASASKFARVLEAQVGGRLQGTLQYCGASRTGRWAGRLFQPQNLPSRDVLPAHEVEHVITALRHDMVNVCYDDVMHAVSSCVRGVIIAGPDKKLVCADLSNIEGRVLAWLAGEAWKLDAFRAFDQKRGHDLYKLAYAKSFGVAPADVTKAQRQVGKVQELALGYEGGVGAFVTFATGFNIDLNQLAREADLPADLKRDAERFYESCLSEDRPTHGLSREAFVACDVIKRAWRRGHPATVALWRGVDEAVRAAIDSPGKEFTVRSLTIVRRKAWLTIVLPSGRVLCYPQPRIEGGKISYAGSNQWSRSWGRIQTYAGKLVENITQAVARDVMAHVMLAVENARFQIVLTVHDEIVTEAPMWPEFSAEKLSAIMSRPPRWAPDLPLAASGFESHRYRKD